ncbi:M23 family metallopeptidase [Anaerovorax odorimutans]|uniref:M23 family metallopeptidase n=1 Tax=Anaerovorax odorimutans TaxID=109327 RepID=A0ABT1RPM8_9FIRM|nr:M23 family metallopeptidase [Anaerovorax odorimutans]MCQ4637147.1 M23 family metallopeptidase [Anaerovorax odorimutans]
MGDWVWPLPGYSRISSPFGLRNCPFHGRETHTGIDIPAPQGTKIIAAKPGRVITAKMTSGYGNLVVISHGGGLETYYAHCNSFIAHKGDTVGAGQPIARVGSTGPSTGNHLHFGVKVQSGFKNPKNYVSINDTQSRYTGAKSGPVSSDGAGSSNIAGGTAGQESTTKEVTTVKVTSTTGKTGNQDSSLRAKSAILTKGAEILIQNGSQVFQPALEEDISLEYERKNTPGKLTFTVYKDAALKIAKGNAVRFRYNNKRMFFGYIFTFKRKDSNLVTLTCYDQLRYLKNKDVRSYKKTTYSKLLKQIAKEFKLEYGTIQNTKYVIPARMEEGTLFDILGNASDLTVSHTKKLFVLYDDFGRLTLKNIESMMLPILVDQDTAESLDYESTIDKDTYNRIKIYSDNDNTGVREVHVRNSTAKQKKWGILQYTEKAEGLSKKEMKQKAKILAQYYGIEQRTLSVRGQLGDTRVRGGSSLIVQLDLGDKKISNYMLVEKVKHTFKNGSHTMDLSLAGIKGEFHV